MSEEEIYRYLRGDMNKEALQAFEERLATDEALQIEVQHSRQLLRVLSEDRLDFRNKLAAVVEQKRKPAQKPVRFLVAAVLALLLLSTIAYFTLQTGPDAQALAISYTEPYPDVLTSRDSAAMVIPLQAYNLGDYEAAIAALQPVWEVDKDAFAGMYLGVSYLMRNDPNQAAAILNDVVAQGTAVAVDASWYQALALIAANRAAEARPILIRLKKAGPYKAKSSKLLEAIVE